MIMTKKIEAVVFDRDGVLADFDIESANIFYANYLPDTDVIELSVMWQQWGEKRGFPATLEGERDFFDSFWQHLGLQFALRPDTIDILRASRYTDHMFLFPEVKAGLNWLKAEDIKVGVLSNFSLASIEESLNELGILQYVDVACAATVIGVSKPDPRSYKIVLDKLRVDPHRVLYFDDEEQNVAGARDAGIDHAYLVDRKSGKRSDLTRRVVTDLSEIRVILESLNQ
jgi:FMN phosphatase YigB (HAD superfamily)